MAESAQLPTAPRQMLRVVYQEGKGKAPKWLETDEALNEKQAELTKQLSGEMEEWSDELREYVEYAEQAAMYQRVLSGADKKVLPETMRQRELSNASALLLMGFCVAFVVIGFMQSPLRGGLALLFAFLALHVAAASIIRRAQSSGTSMYQQSFAYGVANLPPVPGYLARFFANFGPTSSMLTSGILLAAAAACTLPSTAGVATSCLAAPLLGLAEFGAGLESWKWRGRAVCLPVPATTSSSGTSSVEEVRKGIEALSLERRPLSKEERIKKDQ